MQTEIIVNNRVITNVNDKPITVMDLMKRMDMTFYSQFPEYAGSVAARYQFYTTQWKAQLKDLIDRELVLADAASSKIEVTNADIRKEIELSFGPNVFTNLDKAGLSFEEAWALIRDDIMLRRIMMARVNMKAMRFTNPLNIRHAYEEYTEKNYQPETWTYQMVSVKSADPDQSQSIAEQIHSLLENAAITIDDISSKLSEHISIDPSISVNVTNPISQTNGEINPQYKDIIAQLEPGTFSPPISQKSRKENKIIHRIFYLNEAAQGGVLPLPKVANELRDKILHEAISEETDRYIKKLRKEYGFENHQVIGNLPENFQPFILKTF
ncbi:MAG: hypothetical protein Tsb0021_02010 [Chlamydiales bacterium]